MAQEKEEVASPVQKAMEDNGKAEKPKILSYPEVEPTLPKLHSDVNKHLFLYVQLVDKTSKKPGDLFKLALPERGLNFQRTYNYNGIPETAIGQGASALVSKILGTGSTDLSAAGASAAKRFGTDFVASMPGIQEGLGKSGFAINPNVEIYFVSEEFREFSFTFDFLPKNTKEAANVKEITKALEKYSLPVIDEQKNLFGFPNTFMLEKKRKNGGKLLSSKECVITSLNITHGSEKGYTVFHDGYPTMTRMTVSFREIELWSQRDIELGK